MEQTFLDALDICRWDAYAAVGSDVAIMCEGFLRPHVDGDLPGLSSYLTDSVAAAFRLYPAPSHFPDGWEGEIEACRDRLIRAQLAAPIPVHEIGHTGGARIFKSLPIHPRLRLDDQELIENNVRANLCRSYETMLASVDPVAVASSVAGRESTARESAPNEG